MILGYFSWYDKGSRTDSPSLLTKEPEPEPGKGYEAKLIAAMLIYICVELKMRGETHSCYQHNGESYQMFLDWRNLFIVLRTVSTVSLTFLAPTSVRKEVYCGQGISVF